MAEVRLHYFTLGKPHKNGAGQLDNAVLLLHGTGDYGGGFLVPTFTDTLYGPGQPLDLKRFYVICPDILGHGQSSKPSDGLHARFPSKRHQFCSAETTARGSDNEDVIAVL